MDAETRENNDIRDAQADLAAPLPSRPAKKGIGRPKGSSNFRSKQPSAIAQAFKKAGLDWRIDFAEAIKANKRERIKLWLRLLPYLITTGSRVKVRTWKGRASKAALVALEAMENNTNDD